MKIIFRPQDDRKISLFANWGEAVVFWLCLGGLIFFGLITIVRSIDRSKTRDTFQEFRAEQQQVLQRIEFLENQNKAFNKQNDSLKMENVELQSEVTTSQEGEDPPLPSRPLTEQEKNRKNFLDTSKN